jgi:acetyltransferase-like isoleucine patch superfamily enzyme
LAIVNVGIGTSIAPDVVIESGTIIGNHVTIYPGVVIGESCRIFDGAIIGRPPVRAGVTTRPVDPRYRELRIGAGSVIGAHAVLYTGVRLGTNVLIGDLASLREDCEVGDSAVLGRGVMVMYQAIIGARTRVIDGAILTGNIVVEEDVFIGPGVCTVNDNEVYLARFGLSEWHVRGPIIRRWALIGTGATIMSGVEIGRGALVVSGSVVTKDVPAWTVVAGMPAQHTRAISAEDRAKIEAIKI